LSIDIPLIFSYSITIIKKGLNMSIDLSENGNVKNGYEDLKKHIGHNIVVVGYGTPAEPSINVAIECEDCNEVLIDFDKPK